jgi:DNA ligase-1
MNSTLPPNPAGFWLSEKLDGVRFLWTGTRFHTRNGKDLHPPAWFTEGLPPVRLDGELYAGRGGFDFLVSQIQKRGGDWQGITYQIFELAVLRVPIESRLSMLARLRLPAHVGLVKHRPCTGWQDLDETEAALVGQGAEGLVLREPGSCYRPHGFWKVKRLTKDLDRSILD